VGHLVEHILGEGHGATGGVHVEQSCGNKSVGVEGVFEKQGVDLLAL